MYQKIRNTRNSTNLRILKDVIPTKLHKEVQNMEINEMCFNVFLLYAYSKSLNL